MAAVAVAFPIVRRVFGNLLAQDLVSVQPMSLPSGLIFFLDFLFYVGFWRCFTPLAAVFGGYFYYALAAEPSKT